MQHFSDRLDTLTTAMERLTLAHSQQNATAAQHAQQAATAAVAEQTAQTAQVTAQQTGNWGAKAPKPDKFSGDTGRSGTEALDWCFSITGWLTVSGKLNDLDSPNLVALYLTGNARTWWRSVFEAALSMQAPKSQPFASWHEMRAALLEHFSSTRSGKEAFARLCSLEQRGTAREYTRKFRDLSLQADKDLLTPSATMFYYIRGLRIELRTHVETLDPASYDEAVKIAEAADEAHSYSNRARRSDQRPAETRNDRQAQRQQAPQRQQPARDQRDQRDRPARHHAFGPPGQDAFRRAGVQRPGPPAFNHNNGPVPMELGAVRAAAPHQQHHRHPARQGN